MVSIKSFTLLVAKRTRPLFAFVSIISVNECLRIYIMSISDPLKDVRKLIFPNFSRQKGVPPFKQDFHQDFRLFSLKIQVLEC